MEGRLDWNTSATQCRVLQVAGGRGGAIQGSALLLVGRLLYSSLGEGSHTDGLTHRLQSCHRGYSTRSPVWPGLAGWLQGARHSLPVVQCLVRADALWRPCQEKQSPSHVVPSASFFPQTRLSLTVQPFSLQASALPRSRLPPGRNSRASGHSPHTLSG